MTEELLKGLRNDFAALESEAKRKALDSKAQAESYRHAKDMVEATIEKFRRDRGTVAAVSKSLTPDDPTFTCLHGVTVVTKDGKIQCGHCGAPV